MNSNQSRRSFLGSATSLGVGGLASLTNLTWACADDEKPLSVKMDAAIAPLVKLIENTPREKAVAMMVEQLGKGVTVNQFVAAMFLASARMKVSPHHVYMIFAALRMSTKVDAEYKLLPLFWALDTLQYNRKEGDRFPAPDLSRATSAEKATAELHDAMDHFDAKKAESALISLSRSTTPKAALAQLWRYTGRDDSFIGHRAIAMTNSWRVLDTIGWEHAEPLFQFVAREMNAGGHRHAQHKANHERSLLVGDLPGGWAGTTKDRVATLELFEVMRAGDDAKACEAAFKMLQGGKVQAGSIWDAAFLIGAEFLLRIYNADDMGTTPVHTNTTTNALRYAFDHCGDPKTQLYTILAAVAWATGFYGEQVKGKWFRDLKLTTIEPVEVGSDAKETVAQIFAAQKNRKYDVTQKEILVGREGTRKEMDQVARLAFCYATKHKDHSAFLQMARFLTSVKSTQDAHDMKFPAAMFENYDLIDPQWRPHLLAASTHYLHGSKMIDNPGVQRAKEALGSRK